MARTAGSNFVLTHIRIRIRNTAYVI